MPGRAKSKGLTMADFTNEDRAGAALVGLTAYAQHKGLIQAGEDAETILGDFFADVRHYADAEKLDVAKLWARGQMNHAEELQEERDSYSTRSHDPLNDNDR